MYLYNKYINIYIYNYIIIINTCQHMEHIKLIDLRKKALNLVNIYKEE